MYALLYLALCTIPYLCVWSLKYGQYDLDCICYSLLYMYIGLATNPCVKLSQSSLVSGMMKV